jgi:hypothetical protein
MESEKIAGIIAISSLAGTLYLAITSILIYTGIEEGATLRRRYVEIMGELDKFRLFRNSARFLVAATAWLWLPPVVAVGWIWEGILQDITPRND